MKFRKKPVVIDAWRYNPLDDSKYFCEMPQWLGEAYGNEVVRNEQSGQMPFLLIKTLVGEMRADHGDWIIRGIRGEIYPCKPDIFEASYEPAPATEGATQ